MDEKKKNLCAMIPESLHIKVREEQEQLALTLSEYVEKIIGEHFEGGRIKLHTSSQPARETTTAILFGR